MLHRNLVSIVRQFILWLEAFSHSMWKLDRLSLTTTNQSAVRNKKKKNEKSMDVCVARVFSSEFVSLQLFLACLFDNLVFVHRLRFYRSHFVFFFAKFSSGCLRRSAGVRCLPSSTSSATVVECLFQLFCTNHRNHVKTNDKSINKIYEEKRRMKRAEKKNIATRESRKRYLCNERGNVEGVQAHLNGNIRWIVVGLLLCCHCDSHFARFDVHFSIRLFSEKWLVVHREILLGRRWETNRMPEWAENASDRNVNWQKVACVAECVYFSDYYYLGIEYNHILNRCSCSRRIVEGWTPLHADTRYRPSVGIEIIRRHNLEFADEKLVVQFHDTMRRQWMQRYSHLISLPFSLGADDELTKIRVQNYWALFDIFFRALSNRHRR